MAEKLKIENILRKELVDVAEKLYLKKYDRNIANQELTSLSLKLNKLNHIMNVFIITTL